MPPEVVLKRAYDARVDVVRDFPLSHLLSLLLCSFVTKYIGVVALLVVVTWHLW
jgi:hypothetical protein